jgi:uncharacterized membrane protein
MKLSSVVRVVAVVCTGLLAGIYLSDWMGGAYARTELSASGFVQYQQIVHVHFAKFMPFLVIGGALASIAWMFFVRSQRTTATFWLILTATCAIIVAAVLTRMVNIPINELLMTWSIGNPPPDLRELWAPWETVNTIRTFLTTGAFVCQVVALAS